MLRRFLPLLLLIACRSDPGPAPGGTATASPPSSSGLGATAPSSTESPAAARWRAYKKDLDAASAFNVDAARFYADYHANEVAADEKYKGKRGVLMCIVMSINKDALDKMIVECFGGSQSERVFVTLQDSQTRAAAALHKGDVTVFLATGDTMIMGVPRLVDATVLTQESMDAMTLYAVDAGILPASALTTLSSASRPPAPKPPAPKVGGRKPR